MCDIRLFRSAMMDYETAAMIWRNPYNDEWRQPDHHRLD